MLRNLSAETIHSGAVHHRPIALVVDDERSVRGFFSKALLGSGWDSVAVDSGKAAVDRITAQHFDAIFLDLSMPGFNGADTLEEIRNVGPEANVVIVTGYYNSPLMNQVLRTGPIAMLSKPCGLDELWTVLDFLWPPI